ncbi:MAG: glycosyltransferase family 39 protein [Anaerolineaceae bacterium]|nr:glycosyltransferase family 39 protein [Anaerolineaceae bacterium]
MVNHGKKDLWIISILFLASLLMQVLFLNPPVMSDQMEYYSAAVRFPRLPETPNIASMQLGVILPVAVLYRIFGQSEAAYYGLPLLSTAVFYCSVYLLGRSLFNRRVGLFAAVWLMLTPQMLMESGHLLPDMPAAAFFTVGITLLVYNHSHPAGIKPLPKNNWLFFLAGLLFGWSYLCKEYIAVLFALIPILFRVLKIPYRCLIPTAAGMLLMLGLEMSVGLAYYQNPLIRFLAAQPRETIGFIETDIGKIIQYLPILLKRKGGSGTFYLMVTAIIGAAFFSFKKSKSFIFLLSWMLLFYAFFTLMGLLPVIFSWEDIALLRLHKFRYWIPILPPIVISGVATLDRIFGQLLKLLKLHERKAQRISSGVVAVCLIITAWIGISAINNAPYLIRNGSDHYQELREYLKNHNSEVNIIWVTRDSRRGYARIMPMYSRTFWGKPVWEGTIKYLNTDGLYLRAEEIEFGHVIIDRDFNNPNNSAIPEYLSQIPATWRLVFESENRKIGLYVVGSKGGNVE